MTQADSVHSTLPLNTSALPVEPTRRHLIAMATGGAVAAAISAAALAAASAVDPNYAAIDKHRRAVAAHDAVTDVRAAFERGEHERRTEGATRRP